MPDIATALRQAINTWDGSPVIPAPVKPAPQAASSDATEPTQKRVTFAVTNNVCRSTFEAIRDNPGKTRKEIVTMLTARGFKEASTATLIGQMIKQDHIRDSRGLLFSNYNDYRPLKSAQAWAAKMSKQVAKKVVIVNTRTNAVVSRPVAPKPVSPALPAPTEWSVDSVVDKLSVKQALAVYDELRKIFGA